MKKLQTTLLTTLVCLLFSCVGTGTKESSIQWGKAKYPGVWEGKIGSPSQINLLNVTNATPRKEALNKKEERSFPIDPAEITVRMQNGRTYLRLPLDREEQIFGLGLHFKTIDQRGRILRLHMDHYGKEDNGRTHAPVPFFVSSKGYGVLINSASYIDAYVGTGVRVDSKNPAAVKDRNTDRGWSAQPYSDNIELVIPDNGVEVVVFSGDNMLDVVSRFNLYCGGGFIPPKWGLGFWHRTPTRYSDKQVMTEVRAFQEKGFPLDVIGLEPGWHSQAYPCSFDWSAERFPNPKQFIDSLGAYNIKVNLWCNPYVAPETPLAKKIAPYSGTHTVWCGLVPDYTMEKAREVFRDHINKGQLQVGVSGYKVDEVDGYDRWLWPDVAEFPSGISGEQMRSVYGNLVMATIDRPFRDKNERTYGLVRAMNAGSVSMPYAIYNDNYSHRDFITAISSSSFIGVMWTPEVRGSGSSEEWLRRMQTTCFAPIAMLNAWADGTKPWSYPDVYDKCQAAALLRMQLLPYLYTAFSDYYLAGIPPFRAMNMVEGYDGRTQKIKTKLDATDNPYETVIVREIKDQYMVGDNILVAPFFAGDKSRNVVLPKGKWYDFYTGLYVGAGEIITIEATLDYIPMFVRDGGIVPMVPSARNTHQWSEGLPLEVRVYGSKDGSFDLYDDDGSSYDYEKGNYTIKRLLVKNGIGSVQEMTSKDGLWSYGTIDWKFMSR